MPLLVRPDPSSPTAHRSRRRVRPARRGAQVVASIALLVATAAGPGATRSAAADPPHRPLDAAAVAFVGAAEDDGGLPTPEPSADQARRDADAILAKPEYQEPPKSLIEKVTDWFGEQLQKLFSSFTGGSGGGLTWVILAVLVGVAIYLLTKVRGGVFSRRHVDDEPLFSTAIEARRSPVEWLAEAERLEAAGDWKAGLRARYRALVGGLIAEQILRDIPGRTTGEYRIEMRRAAPPVAGAFAEASGLFERAWYGDEPTGPAQSQQFQALAAHIAEQARRLDDAVAPR